MKFHPFIGMNHSLTPLYDRKFYIRLGSGPSRGTMTVGQLFYRYALDARVWNLYFPRDMQTLGFLFCIKIRMDQKLVPVRRIDSLHIHWWIKRTFLYQINDPERTLPVSCQCYLNKTRCSYDWVSKNETN